MTLSGALVNGLAIAAATALVSIGICLNALYRPKGRGKPRPFAVIASQSAGWPRRSVPHPAQNHGPPASPEGRFIR